MTNHELARAIVFRRRNPEACTLVDFAAEDLGSDGHAFLALALQDDAPPTWDADTAACLVLYCTAVARGLVTPVTAQKGNAA